MTLPPPTAATSRVQDDRPGRRHPGGTRAHAAHRSAWRQRIALAALVAVLSAVACAGPTDNASPGTTQAPVPITARPLDLTRYLAAPCSMVPAGLTERLGLTRREERHENVLIGAGSQAQCRISAAPPLTGVAELRLYPASRPLPLLTGVTPAPTPTFVGAYPAGQWILSTGRDGSATSCHSIVDVASGQGFSVLVNGPAGEAIAKSCARARRLAESVLAGQLI